jgi:hypothetical protein
MVSGRKSGGTTDRTMMAVAKLHAAIRATFKNLNRASLCLMEIVPSGGFARTSSP